MGVFNLVFGGIVEAGKQLGSLWLTNKKTKIEGKIALNKALVQGDLDYNVAAQRASETSWKDEFLTVFTCTLMAMCFIPHTQPAMKAGFIFLKESTPDWFSYCIVGMYVAVYGLKGWKIFANK